MTVINPQEIFEELGAKLGPKYKKQLQDRMEEKAREIMRLEFQMQVMYDESYLGVAFNNVKRELGINGS